MNFNMMAFHRIGDTFEASHRMIEEMKSLPNIEEWSRTSTRPHILFLFSRANKAAVMIKTIVQKSHRKFENHVGSAKNQFDLYGMDTTIDVAKHAVNNFLNEDQFKDITLAVICGHRWHECCVFFRKHEGRLEAIFYNANLSVHTQGTQSSNVVTSLLKLWGNALKKIQTYYAPSGNIEGQCVGYVWNEIFRLVCKGVSPFSSPNIHLKPFHHFMTEGAYKRKEKQFSAGKSGLVHYKLWERMDNILCQKSEREMQQIAHKMAIILL